MKTDITTYRELGRKSNEKFRQRDHSMVRRVNEEYRNLERQEETEEDKATARKAFKEGYAEWAESNPGRGL